MADRCADIKPIESYYRSVLKAIETLMAAKAEGDRLNVLVTLAAA